MHARSLSAKLFLTVALALAATFSWAQDGLEGALSRANRDPLQNFSAVIGRTLAVADFDNDRKLDGAILLDSGRVSYRNRFRIQFHFSGSNNTELAFESSETALAITALDVNHDGATDLVVEQSFTHKRLYVWLNDGHGGFHRDRVEDFQTAESFGGNRLLGPDSGIDYPLFCLIQQRGIESGILAGSAFRGRPPSTSSPARPATIFLASSTSSSAKSSRAPPSLL
jgi:hypothetical protein